jgi:uncharacterized protein YbjQ (UPF0145 family)
MLIVTTDEVPGRAIDTVIGEVVGLTARTLNPFSEGIKRVDGLPTNEMIPSLLRWRRDAIANLAAEADLLGADAVIGMKFDNRILSSAWTEICAYGTAVLLVPAVIRAENVGRARPGPPVAVRLPTVEPIRYLPSGGGSGYGADASGVNPAGVDMSGGSGGMGDGT